MTMTFAFQAYAHSDSDSKDRDKTERASPSDERNREAKDQERERKEREKVERERDKSDGGGSSKSDGGGSGDKGDQAKSDDGKSGSGKSESDQSGSGGGSSGGSGSSGGGSGEDGSGKGSGQGGTSSTTASGQSGAAAPAVHQADAAIERDVNGRERRSDEVLFVGKSDMIEAAKARGFDVIETKQLSTSGETIARVRVREGESVETTLERLKSAAPEATVAPNHVFRPSAGDVGAYRPARAKAAASGKGRMGIIDTGVDVEGLGLQRAVLSTRSFTGGAYTPRPHGSTVAVIAANSGVSIDAADVFATDASGALYATAEATAAAVDWLVERGAPVINISIQGPDNPVLEKVIKAAIARGVVIVAAAGNEGPSAPPSYPAAYGGVVGVTAVDGQGRIYRRANRGDYISFAALGVHVPVAGPQKVSGTSFAAPTVAAEVARRLHNQSPDDAARVLTQLRAEAVDLGPPGRDKTFGWGWLR
ncbi:MAG: S8 family serine peptidase [Alphaproteobacteria bacterium]|nr:S8 family serine peptidase [Alphaproteobacteria bacterium]